MATIIRRNERSWAIELISEINIMLSSMGLLIKRAGGESTLSVERKSMFPDVLLYGDVNQKKIMQGWELKLPDTPITDETFIKDANRKALALGLNSFFIWNFTSGVLYVKNSSEKYEPIKTWNETNYIKTREDVTTYKAKWLTTILEVILEINEYFITGKLITADLGQVVSDNLLLEVISRNQKTLANHIMTCSVKDTTIKSHINAWWYEVKSEYISDQLDMFNAYAKVIILRWLNRITFAHLLKKYYAIARKVEDIDFSTTPNEANDIFEAITNECDFYNVFSSIGYDNLLDSDTWYDLVDVSTFLKDNGLAGIEHTDLQDILENTVISSKREVRGQFTTPPALANFLARVTVRDWTGNCIDPCCGTGSIAKEILNEKVNLLGTKEAYETTWASDKFSFPLQISNISLTRADAMNLPCRLFQRNVFELQSGDNISITNPVNGEKMQLTLPKFSAVVSNLPFVPFEIISLDDKNFIGNICDQTREPLDRRGDIYSYIIFSLWNILETGGHLGVIVSNSWLGTEWGSKFLEQLPYYYDICNVVISGAGRWFKNADVITTILILKKKAAGTASDSQVCFSVLKKSLEELERSPEVMSRAVDSIVLSKQIDPDIVMCQEYSFDTIKELLNLGVSKNALFHDVSWLNKIKDKLIPVTDQYVISRGERRGQNALFYPEHGHGIEPCYIKPVLKNPKKLQSLIANTDIEAFCCHMSMDELYKEGHNGAVQWIKKFENQTNGTGRPLPEVLSRTNGYWYEMSDSSKASMITILNPNERLFVSKFQEPTFVDQRFTRINPKNTKIDVQIGHALLNSIIGMFYIEAIGFGRGLGVLDTSSTHFKNVHMLNPNLLDGNAITAILQSFQPLLSRNILTTSEEMLMSDRKKFDMTVLEAFGIEEYYNAIKNSLMSMQQARLSANHLLSD